MSICTPITSVVTAPCLVSCLSSAVSSAGCAQTDYSCHCDVGTEILLDAFDCAIVPCGNLPAIQILHWDTVSGVSYCDCITASLQGAGVQTAVVSTTENWVVATSAAGGVTTYTDSQGIASSSTVRVEASTSSAAGGGAAATSTFVPPVTIVESQPGSASTITVHPILGQSSSGGTQPSSTPGGVTSSSSSSSGMGLKIGLGVGIPVGALLLAGLIFLILHKRKSDQRIRDIQAQLETVSGQLRENKIGPIEPPADEWKRKEVVSPIVSPVSPVSPSPRPVEVPGEGWKVELDGPTARVHELHEDPVIMEPDVPSRGPG